MGLDRALAPNRFADHPALLLAGIRRHHAFRTSATTLADQWHEFEALGAIPGRVGALAYGAICGADPAHQTFEYLSGVEVESFATLPSDLGRMRVPAQHYAVFAHDGPIAEIGRTWEAITNRWLPASGFRSANLPDFERYDERFDPATASGVVEIWIGVVANDND